MTTSRMKWADDFLDYVNASPTREFALASIHLGSGIEVRETTFLTGGVWDSVSCGEEFKRAVGKGGVRRYQGELKA